MTTPFSIPTARPAASSGPTPDPPPTAASGTEPPPQVAGLVRLAVRGLSASFIEGPGQFAHTVRAVQAPNGIELVREGQSLRYAAIVALGIARLCRADQASILGALTVPDLVAAVCEEAGHDADPGAVALAAWAAAEAGGAAHPGLLLRLDQFLTAGAPLSTVDVAWMLTAAVASHRTAADDQDTRVRARRIQTLARTRLLAAQGTAGLFPHALPARSLGRWRAHVGCFADQIYPIQALARLAMATGDTRALEASNLAARRICELQGTAGQWWWHYDARHGTVVEGYPVYSVHQHGMAPMALRDLIAAGGDDHSDSLRRGVDWLDTHPEVIDDLISERRFQVWRKVGRQEPAKAARKLSAVTTALRPGWRLPGLAAVLPPTRIDHECRPYELGWLVYAWGTSRPYTEREE